MPAHRRIPKLANSNIVIRLTQDTREIEAANDLIYRNYVGLYWPDDKKAFQNNRYLHSSSRHVFVAVDLDQVIGTMSIVMDSPIGLPSDGLDPNILRRYRQNNERLAELTSFAVEQSVNHPSSLILFLYKFFLQYSFYYTNVDRLIGSCRPKHADFYENVLCFEKLTAPTPHSYAGNVECQLVTLPLLRAHLLLSQRYEDRDTPEQSLYRFLYVDDHPNVHLPDKSKLKRSRQLNWAAIARGQEMPIAV